MPGLFFIHLLEFSFACFTVTSTTHFPTEGHSNLSSAHIQTLVTLGTLFYSQCPNGDEVILILFAKHFNSFSFSIFPLSLYKYYEIEIIEH